MERIGRCTNYARCLTGYRCANVTIERGSDFVCPECGQPLTALEPEVKEPPGWINQAKITGVVLVVLTVAAAGLWMWLSASTQTPTEETFATTPGVAAPSEPEVAAPEPQPTAAAVAATTSTPFAKAPAVAAATESPAPLSTASRTDEFNRTKREVLKRIDLMPNVAPANKDRLYVSVERAREMRKIATITFEYGKVTPSAADIRRLNSELQSPEIQRLLQDPTIVFVILGYADLSGDSRSNMRVSQNRGQGVLEEMRDSCGIVNVMHVIAMGGSNLLDETGVEKNRAAEVWAVLP
jgi:outer membrane protein OmpA-like peptidoglycan-associated protein